MKRTIFVGLLTLGLGLMGAAACDDETTGAGGGGTGGSTGTTTTSDTSTTSSSSSSSSSTTSTTGSGGGGTGGAGGGTGGGGVAGSVPFQCIDIASISPNVDFPPCNQLNQATCTCEGCTDDGVCYDDQQELADDCVCPDCADAVGCRPPNCVNDGTCNPYLEGCLCPDCAGHPRCP